MSNPIVSIIMSTYNDSEYLSKSIESVLNQTYKSWEYIIINDCSTDSTDNIVKKYVKKYKNIRYLTNKKNLGYTKNLKTGVLLSIGEYIARIDSNDVWSSKNKLALQVRFLEKNIDYGLVGTWGNAIDEKDKFLFPIKTVYKDRDIKNRILSEVSFIHSSILVRRELVIQEGNYDPKYEPAEDYALWLKIGLVSKLAIIPKRLVSYRIQSTGVSPENRNKQIDLSIKLIKKYKDHYPNFFMGLSIWIMKKYYPEWFRYKILNSIKQRILGL